MRDEGWGSRAWAQSIASDKAADVAVDLPNDEDRYVEGGVLGIGGMGIVRSAHDQRLQREVAIKEVREPSPEREARLAREARITSLLEHPGVIPIYDVGLRDGRLFYAMRLVRGRTVDAVLAETRPAHGVPGRMLRHFLDVCETVAFAHSMGVIHRDLKPQNLLVGEFGETQVGDWGLAAFYRDPPAGLEVPLDESVGTPGFMAPEQARSEGADPRSDVWSLGAILHWILVGTPPHGGLEPDAWLATVRGTPIPPLRGDPRCPADLAAIVDRCLAFCPEDRYSDGSVLAADVARWLDGQLVEAHDYTSWELALRAVKAWRAPLVVAGLAGAILGAGGVVAWQQMRAERDHALQAKKEAEQAAIEAEQARLAADQAAAAALTGQALVAMQEGDRARAEILAAHALVRSELPRARGILAASLDLPRPRPSQPWEVSCPWAVGDGVVTCQGSDEVTVLTDEGPVTVPIPGLIEATWRGDRLTAVVRGNRRVDVSLDGVQTPRGDLRGAQSLVTLPAGVALVGGGRFEWSGDDGAHQIIEVCEGPARMAAAHDEQVVVVCEEGFRFGTIEELPRAPLLPFEGDRVSSVWFGPDDELVYTTLQGQIVVGDQTLQGPKRGIVDARLNPGGFLLATADVLSQVTVYDLRTESVLYRLPEPATAVRWTEPLELRTLGTTVREWRLPGFALLGAWDTGDGISDIVVADGFLATAHGSGVLRTWRMGGARRGSVRWQSGVVKDLAVSPDGTLVAAHGVGEESAMVVNEDASIVEVRDTPRSRRLVWTSSGLYSSPYSAGPALDGKRFASWAPLDAELAGDAALYLDRDGGIWQVTEGRAVSVGEAPGATAVAPLGDGVVVAYPDRVAGEGWSRAMSSEVLDVATAGNRVAVGTLDGTTWVLDGAGRVLAELGGHEERVATLAFASDNLLFTAGWDGRIRRWSLAELETDPTALVHEVTRAWDMGLDQALRQGLAR